MSSIALSLREITIIGVTRPTCWGSPMRSMPMTVNVTGDDREMQYRKKE